MLPVLCAKYSIFFYILSTGVIRAALFESLILHHKKNKPEDYCNIPPASTVDIPSRWDPNTKKEPTGLFFAACGRPCSFDSSYGLHEKIPDPKIRDFIHDPYGNRTHVTAVKGPCLNRLTNGP